MWKDPRRKTALSAEENMPETLPESIETEELQENRTSRVAWFITGAMIGAAAALLYAPKRGKETRQMLSERAQQGREAVAETTDDIVDAGKEMFERGRKLVEDAAELFERGRKLARG
jgi:YtxH-like protein